MVTCWGAGGTTTTTAGSEVALSSLSKGGVDGGVAVIVEPHWRQCWGEGGVREHQCLYVRGGRVIVVKGGKGGEGRSRFVVVVIVIVEPCFIKLRGGERGGDI
jgi:hypothetical protein